MRCDVSFFAASGSCQKCTGGGLPPWLIGIGVSVMLAALLLSSAMVIAYCALSWHPGQWAEAWLMYFQGLIFAPGVLGTLQRKLLKSEAPVLLQMGQLWIVFAALASTGEETQEEQGSTSRFWELPYLQHIDFAIGSLRELLYLQCYFEAAPVRLALALATPLMPLLLLVCCLGVEFFKPGSGHVRSYIRILPFESI